METLPLIGDAFVGTVNPMSISLLIVGVTMDIVFGSIPGLSAAMAVALFLPVTFAMQAREAFTLLVAFYIGGISGSLISAIPINIPDTSSSITICFDGSPMAKRNEAGKILGIGMVFSSLGGLLSFLVSMLVAPSVARITLKSSAIEYFGVCLFALSMIAVLTGTSMIKGLLSGCLGLIIALMGTAPIDGIKQFAFGTNELSSGFDILSTLIGIFATAEVLVYAEEAKKMGKATQIKQSLKIKGFGFTWKEFVGQKWNALRSAPIDTSIGTLSGIGGSTADILSWITAKKTSKHLEKYGTEITDGVVASKTSSNAVIGGALIPLLTLGILGDGVTTMPLGAFVIHDLTPGLPLFVESAGLICTTLIACTLANVVMLVFGLGDMRIFVRLLNISKYVLLPVVLVLCTVGASATNDRIFDAQSTVVFDVLGYLMSKFKLLVIPFIFNFVLCNLLGTNLRWGLVLTQNDFLAFFAHLIAAVFIVATVLFVVRTVIKQVRNRKREAVGAAQAH